MNSEFDEFAICKADEIVKSIETKIKLFGIIIIEISYFQNQQNFGLKLGEIEEH